MEAGPLYPLNTTINAELETFILIQTPLLHLRHPKLHALQAAILLASLVIVWLGLDLTI